MDKEELKEFQQIFDSVDISDPINLRIWFESYPELAPSEHCEIAERSPYTIRKWRRRAGLKEVFLAELPDRCIVDIRKPPIHKCLPDKLPKLDVPLNWESNRNWILDVIDNLGVSRRKLSMLIRCHPRKIIKAYARAKSYTPPPASLLLILNHE